MSGVLKLGSVTLGTENSGKVDLTNVGTTSAVSVTLTEMNLSSTNHTWNVKAIDEAIVGATNNTKDDSDSGQLAIYNGTTKLWGITEHGYNVKPKNPGFVAHVVGDGNYRSLSAGNKFPANGTNYNQGNCYNTTTYQFTVPVAGLYIFTFSAITDQSSQSRPMFFVNDLSSYNGVQHGICGNIGGSATNSTSSLIYLQAGDYVDVRSQASNIYYYADAHSTFSGCLIG